MNLINVNVDWKEMEKLNTGHLCHSGHIDQSFTFSVEIFLLTSFLNSVCF